MEGLTKQAKGEIESFGHAFGANVPRFLYRYGAHANIGAAFSHASFEWSKGALLVADIQGVCNGQRDDGRSGRRGPCQEDESREWLLSDPQVLTDGASYNFGRGDLGLKGTKKS